MTWLALGWWQAWTLAAVTAGAVTWLFFLRLRHPRRPVPSLLLWRRALDQERPRSLVERLRRLISLLVVLSVAMLLALAPGRPASAVAGSEARSLVLVIDTSPTMGARLSDGRTRLDEATRRARTILSSVGPGAQVRVADTAGRTLTAAGRPLSEMVRALSDMVTRPGDDRLPRVGADERLLVFTDGVRRRSWPAETVVVSVFERVPNVAITTFDVRETPGRPFAYEALIEVANDASGPQRVTVSIEDTAGHHVERAFDLASGGRVRETVTLQGLSRGALLAAATAPENRYDLDDVAVGYLPVTEPLRTVLVTDGNEALETALGLDPLVDLTTVRPAQFDGSGQADLVVFDGVARDRAPTSPALLVHPPGVAWLDPIVVVGDELAGPAIRTWNASHPVLRSVNPADLRIDRASRLEVVKGAEGVETIARADRSALIVVQDSPARRVILAFDLRASDFPFQVGFPVFMRNVVAWLAGMHEPMRAGAGTVLVPWHSGGVTRTDGAPVPSRRLLDVTAFEAPGAGAFLAARGGDRVPILVNPASGDLASVNASVFDGPSPETSPVPRSGAKEWWPAMLIVAFALATIEWITYHRRVTV